MIQQVEITLKPKSRGFHLVTGDILSQLPKLPKTGIVNIFLVILVDGVLRFQTLVDYFGSYALVEITLLLLVILPTIAVYRLTKEDKTMSKRDYIQANKNWLEAKSKEEGVKASEYIFPSLHQKNGKNHPPYKKFQ